MTCRAFVDSIYDYVTAGLRGIRLREIEDHRGACPDCENYLASYIETVRLAKEAFAGVGGAETSRAVSASNGWFLNRSSET